MIDPTVSQFFAKNAESDYARLYEVSHGPRLTAMVKHFGFDSLRNQQIVDVGGGLGFLGNRLDSSNDYLVVDGADITMANRVCGNMSFRQFDLDHDDFGDTCLEMGERPKDVAFCVETLEHIGNPYHALVQIKKMVKIGGTIVISIPTETVTHNSPYPSLLWPTDNFRLFLSQLALPVRAFWHYQPESIGWPAYHFVCENRPHSEKTMLFPKHEAKFIDCTILQATNL